jgi:hypothetical protein
LNELISVVQSGYADFEAILVSPSGAFPGQASAATLSTLLCQSRLLLPEGRQGIDAPRTPRRQPAGKQRGACRWPILDPPGG